MTKRTLSIVAGVLTGSALYALMRLIGAVMCALAPVLYPNIF